MRKVLIARNSPNKDGQGSLQDGAVAARARALCDTLALSAPHLELDPVRVAPGVVFSLLDRAADVVVAVGYGPQEIAALAVIALPVIWDMGLITTADVALWVSEPQLFAAATAAFAASRAYVDIDADVALAIEDAFKVGISSHSIAPALAAAARPMAVAMGTGLGNMIYAVPMLRWLSERHNTPVDLVIHDKFDQGVTMFARAPWINAVYPGYEYLVGRHYDLFISSVTAGAMRPPVSAKQILFVDQDHDYNEEGRFIHETRLNFLGLEKLFGEDPGLKPDLPLPFIRDIRYQHSSKRIVGIANGKKAALWAKREWAHMEALTQRLIAEGWEVRSFGLPAEYVPGAQDYTHLTVREMLMEIAQCSYFISYDGGIAHMAEGIGVPTLWLFGSTGSVKNGPAFSHSRVLMSERSCGPCLYKAEWLRCTTPACMEDIRLEDVCTALYAMEAEIAAQGYRAAPLPPDARLLRYEIDALQRPGPADLWQASLAERMAILPRGERDLVTMVLGLIAQGDLASASHLARAQVAGGQGGVINLFLRHVLAACDVGASVLDGLLPETLPPLSAEDMKDIVEVALNRDERRLLLHLGIKLFAFHQNRALAMAFLAAAAGSGSFSREISRNIHRAIERFARHDLLGAAPIPAAEFEANPSFRRMRLIRSTPVSQRLAKAAAEIAAPLNLEPEVVLAQGMVPHLAHVTADTPPLQMDLGDHRLSLAPRSTVMVLVPHVMVKNPLPGSSSALLLQHVQRLAMVGLRLLVVTVGFDDIPEGFVTRDSVTYLQAHPLWTAGDWSEVMQRFAPGQVLAYGGVEHELDLPTGLRQDLLSIAMDGLYDLNGFFTELPPAERWAPLSVQPRSESRRAIAADTLTAQLFVPPPRPRPAVPTPLRVVVLLNDARDFAALIRLVTVLPSVRFTVLTGLTHRGIEKNLRCIPPGEFSEADWAASQLLLQFSTRPATLSAEALRWVERGGRCIAAPQALSAGPLAEALTQVGGSLDTLDWVTAIRLEAGAMAGRQGELLED